MIDEIWFYIKKFINTISYSKRGNRFQRYGVSLLLISIVILLKAFFSKVLGQESPFLLLSLCIVVSAWYGGLGPSIFTTILIGLLNDYLFLSPDYTILSRESIWLTVVFIIEGTLISIFSEARRQALEQKDQFIAYMSHELKNPLTAVTGYTELIERLARKEENKKIVNYTQDVKSHLQTITTIINDLLDLAKIESGKIAYHDTEFVLSDIISDVIRTQSFVTNTHKITITGVTKKKMYADRLRIQQVIANLLSNAIKYSPDATKVDLSLKESPNTITVSIRDYGIGISKRDQKRLFDQFYRGSADKGTIQGLGLGLYISYQIIKHYHGVLKVKSIPGKGSTFSLVLPRRTS